MIYILYFFWFSLSSALLYFFTLFFFNDTAPTEIYTLSLHDALPILNKDTIKPEVRILTDLGAIAKRAAQEFQGRSEEHTSELQSRGHLVCRLLLEKKKQNRTRYLKSNLEKY